MELRGTRPASTCRFWQVDHHLVADCGGAPSDRKPVSGEIHVLDVQPGHLAPSQSAQAEHEHHRPPVAGFVGEPEQLFDGEVRVSLALLAWRLDAVARVGWDESVGRGVGADAAQDSEVAQYDGGAPAFGLGADLFLDFGAGQ